MASSSWLAQFMSSGKVALAEGGFVLFIGLYMFFRLCAQALLWVVDQRREDGAGVPLPIGFETPAPPT